VHAITTEYADWLGRSNVPKLFLKVEPGAILTNDTLVNLVRGWPALTEKTVAGVHFVQEDSPDEIGRAIAGWMGDVGLTGPWKASGRAVPALSG
jgi:haloalkane dehalogenase